LSWAKRCDEKAKSDHAHAPIRCAPTYGDGRAKVDRVGGSVLVAAPQLAATTNRADAVVVAGIAAGGHLTATLGTALAWRALQVCRTTIDRHTG
jgi:hypothetical protein